MASGGGNALNRTTADCGSLERAGAAPAVAPEELRLPQAGFWMTEVSQSRPDFAEVVPVATEGSSIGSLT